MRVTTFDEFAGLAARGTFVPVCQEIMADLLTPVSAFLKTAEHSDYAFLLESVEGGEHLGRYSFLGKDPFMVVRGRRDHVLVEQAGTTTRIDETLVATLRRLTTQFQSPSVPGLPRFTGGAVGYLGYEAAGWFEPSVAAPGGHSCAPGDQQDGAAFMLFDTILAFDHVQHRILIIANAQVTPGADLRALYDFACARTQFVERELARELSRDGALGPARLDFRDTMPREAFESAVRTAQEHILAGDVYQVVLSHRLEGETGVDAFSAYRALRQVSPSPYMFFVRMGRRAVAGASPEMLVRAEGRRVETHPIAGTRPRGRDEDEDRRLGEELKANVKERSEHVMLVDLGRNDIGRVSMPGSVRVPQFMALERFSHVMHLVSVVDGQLASDCDRLDALVSCFPAGTVTGAPKVRAMQIIRELEPVDRGVYAGAVGYVDFAGNLDFCIAIRTLVFDDGLVRVQSGAGIVADSDPAAEYLETSDKARSLVEALRLAARNRW
jgi:anthranilate synthase component I